MITGTRPEPPAERAVPPDDGLVPVDLAELSAVGVALAALVLTVGLVKALLTGQPGLDPVDPAIVTSVWLLALACWRGRAARSSVR